MSRHGYRVFLSSLSSPLGACSRFLRIPTGPYTEPGEGPSPADSLARHFAWLLGLALIGIVLLLALLAYSTYTVATVLVPDRGGTFREGVAGSPQYLSPIWCQGDDVDRDLCTLIYRGLTRIDKTGRVVPDLAASWTADNDTTYTFKLKPDQFWQDGRTVTADDVLFTVGVLQDPSLVDTPGLPSFWRNVKVEKIDDLTVRFTLPQPLAPFLDYTTIGLLPKHRYENVPARDLVTRSLAPDPLGAGPMRVTEYAADHLKLEPSTFYGGSTPYISTLEFEFFPDYASVLSAFEAGQIDGIRRILPNDIADGGGPRRPAVVLLGRVRLCQRAAQRGQPQRAVSAGQVRAPGADVCARPRCHRARRAGGARRRRRQPAHARKLGL